MVVVGEWRELQVPGDQGVGHGSPVPHHVDHLALREAGGQEAGLGHQEGFLAANDVCRISVAGYHLQYKG